MFFSPQVFDLQGPSLSQATMESIGPARRPVPAARLHTWCPAGQHLCPGFTTRLYQLLGSHFAPTKASVFAGSSRHFGVWLGLRGSSPVDVQVEWLTKQGMTRASGCSQLACCCGPAPLRGHGGSSQRRLGGGGDSWLWNSKVMGDCFRLYGFILFQTGFTPWEGRVTLRGG